MFSLEDRRAGDSSIVRAGISSIVEVEKAGTSSIVDLSLLVPEVGNRRCPTLC